MSDTTKRAVTIVAFALLAVIAVAGWTRTPQVADLSSGFQPNSLYPSPSLTPAGAPGSPYALQQNCAEAAPVAYDASYAPGTVMVPVATRYRTESRPRVVRSYVEERRYVKRQRSRSTGKSVAIVAGSAGAGAAIGALAGGGKGAAIGALSGGTAGFVYDRLTRNR